MITNGIIGNQRDAIDDEKHSPSFLVTKVNLNTIWVPFLSRDRLSSDSTCSLKWQIRLKNTNPPHLASSYLLNSNITKAVMCQVWIGFPVNSVVRLLLLFFLKAEVLHWNIGIWKQYYLQRLCVLSSPFTFFSPQFKTAKLACCSILNH